MSFGRMRTRNLDMVNKPDKLGTPVEGPMAYTMTKGMLPEREKGRRDQPGRAHQLWQGQAPGLELDPGTRRVRQVPEYGFDQPMVGTGGKMNYHRLGPP